MNLTTKRFSDIVYELLSDYEITLTNPQVENTFPLLEFHTPLKTTGAVSDNIEIRSDFQIQITCWNETQRGAMDMTDKISDILFAHNFNRTQTSQSQYDSIIKKYGITVTFEVRYNGLECTFVRR